MKGGFERAVTTLRAVGVEPSPFSNRPPSLNMSPGRVVDYPLGLRSQGPEFKSPSGRFPFHNTTSDSEECVECENDRGDLNTRGTRSEASISRLGSNLRPDVSADANRRAIARRLPRRNSTRRFEHDRRSATIGSNRLSAVQISVRTFTAFTTGRAPRSLRSRGTPSGRRSLETSRRAPRSVCSPAAISITQTKGVFE